ncbi:MAG: peptidoglycan-associated lipoprotein Pal [Pseudomonadota bacterium]
MNKMLWPVLLALTLSACSSTGEKPAAVETRTAQPAATTTAPSASTSGTADAGVSGSALPGAAAIDPRKDPASPLSKRNVFFDFDSFVVKDEYRPMLEAHAGYLKANSSARLILQGHADERGSREYNLALGQKRAEAVRRVLNVMGVSDAQMEAISFGEEKPRNPGSTEEAYAENRRTDVVYGDE